ncbi:MAG: hypothetical protein KatS3mg035_1333 [Bacteroidia bacterium]|nr:MAG: hypothetical protein KatS3mg035_1333 [Bacteroidia bacterium]
MNIPHKIQWESLENFFQYYNQTVQPNLLEPLGNNLKYKAAFSHGIEFFIQVLTMNILWSKVKAQTTATLKNQDQRIIDLDFTHINFGFDIVMPIQRIFGIGVVMGLHQLKGEFSSGYKYHQNGYISYAQDKVFNGIYSTRSTAEFNYGARINLNFKFVTLVLKAQKMISSKDSQTQKLLPLYDKLSSTATGGNYYSDGEIPQNFSFAPNPNTNYKNLYKLPSGWIFSVSIGIGITNLHD